MGRKAARSGYSGGGGQRELPIMGKRFSQRVQPRQELRIVPPPRWFRGFGRRIDLIECLTFCFEIRSCVQVSSVQPSVSEPISDDGRIDARGNQLDSDAVSKRMWADAFFRE
jgi:hypothetical protein